MCAHLEIEKEADFMVAKYGKSKAGEEALLVAESYHEDICNLRQFDSNTVSHWNKRKVFWIEVASYINGVY